MKEKAGKTALVEWKIPTMPDQKAISKRSAPLLAEAARYEIKSEDHFLASWALIARHDEAIKKISELFDPFVSGLHKLHRMAISIRDGFLDPMEASKEALLRKRASYRKDQEERKRQADAASARLLQAQQKRELENQAKRAQRSGDSETAAALREQKAAVPLPFLSAGPAVPKQAGSVIRKRWIFEIVDPAAVQREYCSPDPKLIRPRVESLGPACGISGLRIEEDESEHSRTVPA